MKIKFFFFIILGFSLYLVQCGVNNNSKKESIEQKDGWVLFQDGSPFSYKLEELEKSEYCIYHKYRLLVKSNAGKVRNVSIKITYKAYEMSQKKEYNYENKEANFYPDAEGAIYLANLPFGNCMTFKNIEILAKLQSGQMRGQTTIGSVM